MKLSRGSRWYDADMNFYQVSNIWYENERDLWVQYTNKSGRAFTCRAEAFVNRFSYTAAK